jgi:hypothetical protein
MASTLDLYIDTSTGALLDGGSVAGGALPTLTRNDSYTLRLRLLEKSASGALADIDTSGASLKVGIGNIEDLPTDGAFKLICNGTTSGSIAYNATAVSVYTAISNNVSTVSLYGSGSYGSYLLTATQPNTAMSFGSDSFTLFPASSVIVNTRRNPAVGVYAQQVVKLVRDPIVYADSFSNASTADQIILTKISDGGTAQNETYDLSFGKQVVGGLYSINWGGTSTTGIAPFASAVTVQAAISSGINTITSNISVQDNGKGGYTIQFTGRLAQTNITTSLLLDASGINFLPLKQTTLTINTSGVEDAFAVSGEDTITPTIEIELTQNGTPKTIYQGNVTIRKDLITAGAVVPGNQAQYYTKSEADALFVEDSPANVDATNRVLWATGNNPSIVWQDRQLYDSFSNLSLQFSDGLLLAPQGYLSFYGSAVTAQPANINVVSGLINIGLIANGSTYGVLPQSKETLTVTTSLNFGTVANNSSNSITVSITGAAVNDVVLLGIPSAVSEGLTFFGHVVAADQVHVDALNATNASKTQSAVTFRITVIGY